MMIHPLRPFLPIRSLIMHCRKLEKYHDSRKKNMTRRNRAMSINVYYFTMFTDVKVPFSSIWQISVMAIDNIIFPEGSTCVFFHCRLYSIALTSNMDNLVGPSRITPTFDYYFSVYRWRLIIIQSDEWTSFSIFTSHSIDEWWWWMVILPSLW